MTMIHEVISFKRKKHTHSSFSLLCLFYVIMSALFLRTKKTQLCKETFTQKSWSPKNKNSADEEERDHCLSSKLSIAIVRKKSQRINLN